MDLSFESRTVAFHCNGIEHFFRIVNKNPRDATKLDVRNYLNLRLRDKSRATTNNDLKTLKRYFRYFLKRPEVVESFRFPQSPFKSKVVLSKHDLIRVYKTIESDIGRVIFLFYASTGLSRSKVLGLIVDEVDFKKRMVVPDCHNGALKSSYVSFYNAETEMHAHTLREWFYCEMENLGVSDCYIGAICGRTPKSVLAQHYTDYNPERLKEIYEKANLKVLT